MFIKNTFKAGGPLGTESPAQRAQRGFLFSSFCR